MKLVVLSVSLVSLLLVEASPSQARDVQQRVRSGEDLTTLNLNRSRTEDTQKLTTEQRIQRLERILESQGLVDMLVRIENMQSELQILRGEIELHTHQLEEIKQRQRDLYVDIDRRLLRLERNAPQAPTASAPVTAAPAPATPAGTAPAAPASGPIVKPPVSTPVNSAPETKPAANFADEQKAYQQAFDLLRELRYDQAVVAFRNFIKQFPQGRYAHIAQYWIGEANYAQHKFKQSIIDYQTLIDSYPNSPKLAEAMLKIGYSEYELKNYQKAQTMLQQLLKNYPGTTEAGQAENLIQKIRLKR